jgi:hypothetical protein
MQMKLKYMMPLEWKSAKLKQISHAGSCSVISYYNYKHSYTLTMNLKQKITLEKHVTLNCKETIAQKLRIFSFLPVYHYHKTVHFDTVSE